MWPWWTAIKPWFYILLQGSIFLDRVRTALEDYIDDQQHEQVKILNEIARMRNESQDWCIKNSLVCITFSFRNNCDVIVVVSILTS